MEDLNNYINEALEETNTKHTLRARQTGMGSWALDAITGMIEDMGKMDSIAFPLALRRPDGHLTHAVAPIISLNVPAPQGKQPALAELATERGR